MLFAVIAVFAMPADPVNVWLFAQEDPTAEIVEPVLANPLSMALRLLVTLTAPPIDAWYVVVWVTMVAA